jgi:hypothetical protein
MGMELRSAASKRMLEDATVRVPYIAGYFSLALRALSA